jgi:hypothetical protein
MVTQKNQISNAGTEYPLTFLLNFTKLQMYISKEVGCRIHKMRNPPLTRNCEREDAAKFGHWETGKTGRKIALKPGDFGVRALV